MEKYNPKALNIEMLSVHESKVTLGFKCNPKLKLKLALEAQAMKLTLSEYVESVISNHDLITRKNIELQKRIEHYENDFLKSLFDKHKNTLIEYKNSNGESRKTEINSLQDIYTVFIQIVK